MYEWPKIKNKNTYRGVVVGGKEGLMGPNEGGGPGKA